MQEWYGKYQSNEVVTQSVASNTIPETIKIKIY